MELFKLRAARSERRKVHEAVYDMAKDTYICDWCGIELGWNASDKNRGSMWGCEEREFDPNQDWSGAYELLDEEREAQARDEAFGYEYDY